MEEHVAEEMEAVLDAYGKVAMKRLIDVVPIKCRRICRETPDATIRAALDTINVSSFLLSSALAPRSGDKVQQMHYYLLKCRQVVACCRRDGLHLIR
jgi:hypothetical protein